MSATPLTLTPSAADLAGMPPEEYAKELNEQWAARYGGLRPPIMGRDMFSLPQPTWALENIMQDQRMLLLHGEAGTGKTFLALDWAFTMSHASIDTWLGNKRSKQFRPLYLYTEGVSGLRSRVKAWEDFHGDQISESLDEGVVFYPEALGLSRTKNPEKPFTDQVAGLMKMYEELDCDMLIVDTLQNTFVGNENMQEDANNYLATLRAFLEGGPVVVVHHNSKGGEYRGSTAFAGAFDTRLELSKKESTGVVTLNTRKQKDGDGEWFIEMKQKVMSWEANGETYSSTAFELLNDLNWLKVPERLTYNWLLENGPATSKEIQEALGHEPSTVDTRMKKLSGTGIITRSEDRPAVYTAHSTTPKEIE